MEVKKNIPISLDASQGETKQQGLINEMLRLIRTELQPGDALPSVNQVSRELKISRDTVFKAYSELKKRKIIKSTPTKGYFVNQEINRALLLLDYYSPFKDMVYQEIERQAGAAFTIDLVFHHYNKALFDTVVLNSIGKYDVYLIMNFDTQDFKVSGSLKRLDPARLMLLDIPVYDWRDFDRDKYSYVWQDFDLSVFDALSSVKERIGRYSDFVMINPDHLKHPGVTVRAFDKYCRQSGIRPHLVRDSGQIHVQKGTAYFILRQRDLTKILMQCRIREYLLGKDVGILAYNDIPLYEFVGEGITVISTDFRKMGELAGRFITEQKPIREFLPTRVIIRNSL